MDNLQYSKKNNIGMNNFRFANIFKHNSVGVDSIKSVVKTVKAMLYLFCDGLMLSGGYMLGQVKLVEQMLQMESSENIDDTLTKEELKTAAEMFLYLNTCPDSSWFKSWTDFYADLFLTQSVDKIILTLNRMMKTETSQDKDGKVRAKKLMKRIKSLMKLKYEEIQDLRPEFVYRDTLIKNGTHFSNLLDSDSLIISHPVHILTTDNKMSPSAFIPFCDFGGNISAMGVKINHFNVPVCNAFEAKIMNDQLCYEVDMKKFSDENDIENELEIGLNFLMDYNEDRQVTFDRNNINEKELSLGNNVVASDQNKHAFIYLDTIGNILKLFQQ